MAVRNLFSLNSKEGAEAIQIASNHGQGDVALEAVDPMIATEIQSVGLQGVDGRFHGAVALAQVDELRIVLALTLGRGCEPLAFDRRTSRLVGHPKQYGIEHREKRKG